MKASPSPRPVIIVEEDPRESRLLAEAFHEVVPAQPTRVFETAEKCIEELVRPGEPDVVPLLFVLDLVHPEPCGLSLIREIRARDPVRLVPIVVVASRPDEASLRACYVAGANSVLLKPIDWHGLRDLARQLSVYWILHNRVSAGVSA